MRVPISRGPGAPRRSLPLDRMVVTIQVAQTARSLIFPRSKLRPSIQTVAATHFMEPLRSPWHAISHSTTPFPSPRPQPPSKLREVTVQKEVGMPFRPLRTSSSFCAHTHTRPTTIDQNCWKESRISQSLNTHMKWQTFYGSPSSYRQATAFYILLAYIFPL